MFVLTSGPSEPSFSSLLEDESSAYPTRKSSLSTQNLNANSLDEAQALFDKLKSRTENRNRSGRDFLAAQRAHLVLLQRITLQHTASRYGYHIGWSEKFNQVQGVPAAELSDIDLSDEERDLGQGKRVSYNALPKKALDGIYYDALMRSVVSQRELRSSFEVSKPIAEVDTALKKPRLLQLERLIYFLRLVKARTSNEC
jgi:hypothetical protein